MEFEFYRDFLEDTEDLEVYSRDLEIFSDYDEFEIDLWAELKMEFGQEKYRFTVTEDQSPNRGRANYNLKVSRKEPLSIEDGWTNWKRVEENEYEGYTSVSFESVLEQKISDMLPVQLDSINQAQLD